jgi:hypothetical protein
MLKVTVLGAFTATVVGLKLFAMEGATPPMPLTARVCGLFEPLSWTVRVATREPDADGVKVTSIAQVAPLPIEAPHVFV